MDKDRAPVLFLDFDGVLHPVGEPAVDDNFRLIENPGLFVWRPLLERILEPYPQIRIVVSSDWRRLFDDPTLIQLLGPLSGRFAGVVESYRSNRAEEILAEVQRRSVREWIAIDDHESVAAAQHAEPRFIACAPGTGLNEPVVQRRLGDMLAALS
ncbi:HAD domain-containing protein [Paraburkholderia sp. C35]|uniref:HAD domain-containing protein n=1 Tax=Paraburkholderia sp. C35 TaxID=2126993 RepID=UPI0013A57D45|nr:HAD domain-containing protein [Paraburkholderia sp. C35]